MSDPKICEPGGAGLVFPLSESEQTWSSGVRTVLYSLALCYIFLSVAIVADKFMDSIEMITSKQLRVRDNKSGKIVTLRRWNDTVANLTLLALGSSAPEILLSIFEIISNEFHAGALGPSTIVGSAAFNLFVILAICIYAVPSPETRAIKEYSVFIVTAVFSIVAYLWLVFVVLVNSPDIITLWEGGLTLALFPILVALSYMADVGYFSGYGAEAAEENASEREPSNLHPRLSRRGSPTHPLKHTGGEPQPIHGSDGKVMDHPAGILSFVHDTLEVSAAQSTKKVKVPVLRCNGTEGVVTCQYHMDNRAGTAVPGRDYTEDSGQLTFGAGEHTREIEVEIFGKHHWEAPDDFQLILGEPTGGAFFNPHDDGGEDRNILTISILNANHRKRYKLSDVAMQVFDGTLNVDRAQLSLSLWKQSIAASLQDDEAESGTQRPLGRFMHVLGLPWKFIFAVLIPPAEYAGGWLAFFMALVFIGCLTIVIIDFAELLGCVIGLDPSIVAITVVALGTSMPDLFASRSAACQDATADASIINVTGSNSVNVFLGIGIPWMMAAIYWSSVPRPTDLWLQKYEDDFGSKAVFVVMGGDLGFSVVVFIFGACVSLVVLRWRRVYGGGELGGDAGPKTVSAALFIMLWFFYIILSVWKIYSPTASGPEQIIALLIAVAVLVGVLAIIGCGLQISGAFNGEDSRKTAAGHDTYPDPRNIEEGNMIGRHQNGHGLSMGKIASPEKVAGRYVKDPLGDSDPIGLDSIETTFGDDSDDDEQGMLSFVSLTYVCLFVARVRRRSRRRLQLLNCNQQIHGRRPPPLSLSAVNSPAMGSSLPESRTSRRHDLYPEAIPRPLPPPEERPPAMPPPLPPPCYAPPLSSLTPRILGHRRHADETLSFIGASYICLFVVRLRRLHQNKFSVGRCHGNVHTLGQDQQKVAPPPLPPPLSSHPSPHLSAGVGDGMTVIAAPALPPPSSILPEQDSRPRWARHHGRQMHTGGLMSFTTVAILFWAVAKLRKGLARMRSAAGDGQRNYIGQEALQRPQSHAALQFTQQTPFPSSGLQRPSGAPVSHVPVEPPVAQGRMTDATRWFTSTLGSHIPDALFVVLLGYAYTQLARPALGA